MNGRLGIVYIFFKFLKVKNPINSRLGIMECGSLLTFLVIMQNIKRIISKVLQLLHAIENTLYTYMSIYSICTLRNSYSNITCTDIYKFVSISFYTYCIFLF